VAIEDRTLHSYVGGWPEYVRVREERAAKPPPAPRPARPARAKRPAPAKRSAPVNPKPARDQARLEREIEAAEAALAVLEDELSEPAAWSTPERSASSTARHEEAKRAVERLYERWEKVG
jgi:ATP-binding cassette, subfamily F, member 3